MSIIKAIPTNVITGFLGVGKTTAIQHLLQMKPKGERWAVLVNEFGEVGIDGGLLNGNRVDSGDIFLREVPGGCMCCAAGLPMQIALNQLIQRARPDRLLIEPTGLGHPQEVLATLQSEHYQGVLDLRATLTLVDARKAIDPRYTEHETFNQQLQVADVLIAHKQDRYAENDLTQLEQYLQTINISGTPLYAVSNGKLSLSWLDLVSRAVTEPDLQSSAAHQHSRHHAETTPLTDQLADSGFLRKDNKGEGFCSSGWIFEPDFEFEFEGLESMLSGIAVERLKAVFITSEGVFAFNQADGVLTMQELDETMDSRIEVIGSDPAAWAELEQGLLAISERL